MGKLSIAQQTCRVQTRPVGEQTQNYCFSYH